ncbi:MAG: formylglycine-generating enzyme family protein [Candidatus Schekmanbacteria bacterium]|nr:formylglycine-generating enzyme family protein [Candidatus Schekmanbacteria bacterium]
MKKKDWLLLLAGLCIGIGGVPFGVPTAAAESEMVLIPAGEFTQGLNETQIGVVEELGGSVTQNSNAMPARKVNLPAYYIDKFEVTNEEYKKFLEATKSAAPENWENGNFPAGKGKHPVTGVSLEDAKAYAKWAGKRLPTEAEWEKAARGTDGRLFPWGDKYEKDCANTDEAGKQGTTPVGSFDKGKSPYGVYDLAGNVWEWTSDNYLPYPGSVCKDEFFGNDRFVVRGGSWDDAKNDVVSTLRSKFTPQTTDEILGFRCAKDAK